jgi:surface antigen
MRKLGYSLASLALAGGVLSGCAAQGQQTAQQQAASSCQAFGPKTAGGAAIGGIIGALAGAALGKGKGGNVLMGAAAGAVAGGLVGKGLDSRDCETARVAIRQMDTARTGSQIAWVNPDTGNRGTFTPTSEIQVQNGRQCRSYTRQATIGGTTSAAESGITCRTPDGDWEAVS